MENNNKANTQGQQQGKQNNQKEIWIGVVIIVIVALAAFLIGHKNSSPSVSTDDSTASSTDMTGVDMTATSTAPVTTSPSSVAFNYQNMTYYINGDAFPMVNGATVSGTTASPKLSANLLDGPAFADLNSDGQKDAAVIIRVATAGTPSTLYYLDALLGNGTTATSTNAVFLGDRIQVKSISLLSNQITVSILDRSAGQSFATFPTVAKTLIFRVVGNTLTAVN